MNSLVAGVLLLGFDSKRFIPCSPRYLLERVIQVNRFPHSAVPPLKKPFIEANPLLVKRVCLKRDHFHFLCRIKSPGIIVQCRFNADQCTPMHVKIKNVSNLVVGIAKYRSRPRLLFSPN